MLHSRRGYCIPGRRFDSGKIRPATSFLCPPEHTVRNSTCCPGKGMPDNHRNSSSLETSGSWEGGEGACLRRWVVGNWRMHIRGSLKAGDQNFKRPHMAASARFCRFTSQCSHRRARGQFRAVNLYSEFHTANEKASGGKGRRSKRGGNRD